MAINFIDALTEARRRALLAGKPLSQQETRGMTTGWFDAAAANASKTRAQQIAEKNAADALAMRKWETEEQRKAAKEGQLTGTISNIANNLTSTLGLDYMKSDPGKSMISKGWQGAKDLAGRLIGPGDGVAANTFTGELSKAGVDLATIGEGNAYTPAASLVPESALTGTEAAWAPSGEATGALAGEGTGSILGSLGSAVSYAAPWYALAKGGGMAINAITANNPKLKDTPLGILGEGLDKPLTGVELSVAKRLNPSNDPTVKTISDILISSVHPSSLIQTLIPGAGCIIVTACTDRNSPEVEITRQYRDKFLDKDQLRGYYVLAEKIVPILERNEKVRKLTKKWLVDCLIDYGEKRLGKRQRPAKLMSIIVSKIFLAIIKIVGLVIPHYTRQNGEVY